MHLMGGMMGMGMGMWGSPAAATLGYVGVKLVKRRQEASRGGKLWETAENRSKRQERRGNRKCLYSYQFGIVVLISVSK